MADYKTIPVSEEVHKMILELCEAYEMGQRSQGALVGKLVKAEHVKLQAMKLLPVDVEKAKSRVKAKAE